MLNVATGYLVKSWIERVPEKGLHTEPASICCMPGSRFKFVFWFHRWTFSSIHIDHVIPAPFWLSGPTTARCTISCFRAWFYHGYLKLSQDCCSDFKHQKDGWASGAAWQQAEVAGLVCHNDIRSEWKPDSLRKDEDYWTQSLLYSPILLLWCFKRLMLAASNKPWARWKRTPKPQMISQFKCQKHHMKTCLPFCIFFSNLPTYQMSQANSSRLAV